MTKELLIKTTTKINKASSKRQNSLTTRIPPEIRDILQLKYNDTLIQEVWLENGEKYIKIRKK